MRRAVRFLLIFLSACLLVTSAGIAAGGAYLSRVKDAAGVVTLPQPPVRCTGEASSLYVRGADGEETLYAVVPRVAPRGAETRSVYVTYGELPAALVDAFVAVEDKRFYRHKGVDLIRLGHAAVNYVTGRGRSFGGSTITQQLVKNLTGETERTVSRKLTELFRALELETRADKSAIMEAYLNVINLANGCTGVGMAADFYFSKPVGELTLPECACLAAITQSPARYDPVGCPENNRARRELILSLMETQGYITADERDAAVREGVTLHLRETGKETAEPSAPSVSSWYTDLVIADVLRDMQKRCGMTPAEAMLTLYNGGLHVEIAMNSKMQEAVERYYTDVSHFPTGRGGRPQSALMLIDPHTGDVLAVAGAVGEKQGDRVQSFAWDTRRPAGSTVKPLALWAPALENGLIDWSTVMDDSPVTWDEGEPWPHNADGVYRGDVIAADALALSLNTTAVRLLDKVGRARAFSFLHDALGMTSLCPASDGSAGDTTAASLALGQQTVGVTLRELTAAYTVFTDGVYRTPVSYRRVTDRDGQVLLENPVTGTVVLSRDTAALMTAMLRRVTTVGTASKLTFTPETGIPCAGKTGTTQLCCDRWFIGYTPDLVCGVWMGYEFPRSMEDMGGNPCLRVFDDVMKTAETITGGVNGRLSFPMPPKLVRVTVCRRTGLIPCPDCRADDTLTDGWFVHGTEPKEVCPGHEKTVIPAPPAA